MDDMMNNQGEGWVEANQQEDEIKEGDDDMGRYGRRAKVGMFGGQGGGDDGGNNNKVRGNILSIPPLCAFIASLFEMTT